jgi:hypothetical protein
LEVITLAFNHQQPWHLAAIAILSFQQQWMVAADSSKQQQWLLLVLQLSHRPQCWSPQPHRDECHSPWPRVSETLVLKVQQLSGSLPCPGPIVSPLQIFTDLLLSPPILAVISALVSLWNFSVALSWVRPLWSLGDSH